MANSALWKDGNTLRQHRARARARARVNVRSSVHAECAHHLLPAHGALVRNGGGAIGAQAQVAAWDHHVGPRPDMLGITC